MRPFTHLVSGVLASLHERIKGRGAVRVHRALAARGRFASEAVAERQAMRSDSRRSTTMAAALLLALLTAARPACAEWPRTRADFASLPRYCAARVARKFDWVPMAEYRLWHKRLGPDFIHVHHYCAGLFSLQLARRAPDERKRRQLLLSAFKQMAYTQTRAHPDFLLLPEIHTQMGKVQTELGDIAAAIELFRSAIELKPTYTPAYAGLADVLLKVEQYAEARKVLKTGLSKRPGSKLLRRRLARLEQREP